MTVDGEVSIKFTDIVLLFYCSEVQFKDEGQTIVIARSAATWQSNEQYRYVV
jgi:hypothetical protein